MPTASLLLGLLLASQSSALSTLSAPPRSTSSLTIGGAERALGDCWLTAARPSVTARELDASRQRAHEQWLDTAFSLRERGENDDGDGGDAGDGGDGGDADVVAHCEAVAATLRVAAVAAPSPLDAAIRRVLKREGATLSAAGRGATAHTTRAAR